MKTSPFLAALLCLVLGSSSGLVHAALGPNPADLAISKTASADTVQIGDLVSFTITVTNLGPGGGTNILVEEDMPLNVATVDVQAPVGTSYDTNTDLWSIPSLAYGDSVSLVITVQIQGSDSGAADQTDFANTAVIISSDTVDPNPDNDEAMAVVSTPLTTADLALFKSADETNVLIGDEVQFSVTITNGGPDDAVNIEVEDLMPEGFDTVDWISPLGTSYEPTNGVWTIGSLTSGSSLTLTLTTVAGLAGDWENLAQITTLGSFDPEPSNDVASVTVTVTSPQYQVTAAADIGGSVDPSGLQVANAGDGFTFTATPLPGNTVTDWFLDGVEVQNGGETFYLPDVQANHSVFVTFAPFPSCSGLQSAVNFVDNSSGDDQSVLPDDILGAMPQPGWVNAVGPSGSLSLDGGVTVSWSAPSTASATVADASADSRMMEGYLSTLGAGGSVISVSGLTLPSYDVYVYCGGNNQPGTETRVGHYTINVTNSLYAADAQSAPDFDGNYLESTSTSGGPGATAGNYVVFRNVSGSAFTLSATGDYTSGTLMDAPVNGLQIVPAGADATPPALLPLEFTSIERTGSNSVQISVTGAGGLPLDILVSSNLVDWQLRFSFFNSNGVVTFSDVLPEGSNLFYRATQGGIPFGFDGYTGGTADPASTALVTFRGTLDDLEFDWQSFDPILGTIDTGFLSASNVSVFPGTLACAPRLLFQGGGGGTNFDVALFLGQYDEMIVNVTQTISNVVRRVRFILACGVDLDVDSDNNNGLDLPDRNAAEEAIEDKEGLPGKVIRVNDTDEDGDRIPGFADFDDDAGKKFAKIVLVVPAPIDLTKAKVKFTYDASDPAGVVVGGPPARRVYRPAAGHLRLWKKDAGVARDKTSAAGTGDFIPTAVQMPVAKLGFTGGTRTNVFYMEGIAPGAVPGDQRILVDVDPDGDGGLHLCRDAVRVSVVKVSFSRAPVETAAGNKYGYDEMSIVENDDQISVKKNDATFFRVTIRGLTNASPLTFVSLNEAIAKIEVPAATPAAGFLLKVLGQNQNKNETQVQARAGTTAAGDLCANIYADVYNEIALNGKYYRVFKTGDETNTIAPEIPKGDIETAANQYLKYPVVKVALNDPVKKGIAFDKNNNGKVDYYNNGGNPELDKIYADLTADGITFSDMILFKDKFIDNWYISANVAAGATTITMPGVDGLVVGRHYRIAKGDDSDQETFVIRAIDKPNRRITIDTDEGTPGNQGLANAHARTADVATTSTVKDNDFAIAGLSSNVAAKQPALIVGATAAKVGKLLAHEQMHGQTLSDIDDTSNVMHWNTSSRPTTLPFTFWEQIAVDTGTPRPKVPEKKENQWELPPR